MLFITDNTVGKLFRWLSLLGYDVIYDPRSSREILKDPEFAATERVLLARCPTLLELKNPPQHFMNLESVVLEEQIAQVTRLYPIDFAHRIFTRCQHCNEPVRGPLPVDEVQDRLPPKVKEWRNEFTECPKCRRVYWEGTHSERIRRRLREKIGLKI